MPEHEEISQQTGERRIYASVYRALLAGMYTSTALFAIGVLLALRDPKSFSIAASGARIAYHWGALRGGLLKADPVAVTELATVILILTPVARVLVSLVAFASERNWKYVAITAIVALAIGLSWLLGSAGLLQ